MHKVIHATLQFETVSHDIVGLLEEIESIKTFGNKESDKFLSRRLKIHFQEKTCGPLTNHHIVR
jgi:hypothetical protein